MEKGGEVDVGLWHYHNICKLFVDAVDCGAKECTKGKETGMMVDLSADYRFEKEWRYGLPSVCFISLPFLLHMSLRFGTMSWSHMYTTLSYGPGPQAHCRL